MVNDAAIAFFGNADVVATIAGFHVKYGDSKSSRDNCREPAVGIAQNQNPVWTLRLQDRFDAAQDLADLFAKACGADAERNIRFSYFEFAKEQTAEAIVVILSGVYQQVIRVLIEKLYDQAEANDLGPGSENRHDLQRSTSAKSPKTSSGMSF